LGKSELLNHTKFGDLFCKTFHSLQEMLIAQLPWQTNYLHLSFGWKYKFKDLS